MREIRFRGKRLEDNKWIYGSLVKLDISDNNKHLLGDHLCYIKDDDDKTGNRLVSNYYTDWRCYDVDPVTVGQFTGLRDKNGKEIYEGDIVTILDKPWCDRFGKYHEITWDEYGIYDEFGTTYIGFTFPYKSLSEKILVVGNVFENPELLEGGE